MSKDFNLEFESHVIGTYLKRGDNYTFNVRTIRYHI